MPCPPAPPQHRVSRFDLPHLLVEQLEHLGVQTDGDLRLASSHTTVNTRANTLGMQFGGPTLDKRAGAYARVRSIVLRRRRTALPPTEPASP